MTTLTQRVYELLKTVPSGRVTTYKALAEAAGSRAYRAVGQAMRNNPYAFTSCDDPTLQIPCHRVVASDGTLGGFMGKKDHMTLSQKTSLLASEGVRVEHNRIVGFDRVFYTPRTP